MIKFKQKSEIRNMDKRSKRAQEIIKILKQNNGATVRELAQILSVSEMTIRRDLSALSVQNMIKLVHGAAIFNPDMLREQGDESYHLLVEGDRMQDQKVRIGKMAASLVEQDDVIIIDTGTTTDCMARLLLYHLKITVICYNMNILLHLRQKKDCRLILAGGHFHENTQMFQSDEGVALIRRNRATKAFISAAGISETLGVTCANHYEIATKQAAIASSLQKILLADSTKFGRVRQAHFADLKDFNTIITDKELPGEFAELIRNMGIILHLV